ncbi:sucrose phosphorylase [Lachnospiraceae bacterium YSD2013]|nr:sucrose phosphorylase [Lachnospiraceae bacterium YSD2013]
MQSKKMSIGAMLNAYPDSIGGRLSDIVELLDDEKFKDVFRSIYLLPSVFNTDLDRGFSLINYEISETLASKRDIERLHEINIDLTMDFILNHISVLSPQFQDIIKNGEKSEYKDFFINWNRFWEGCGKMTDKGYIQPDEKYIKNMFFRKEGLPILMVRFPDGTDVPYWNTFYQKVIYNAVDPLKLVRECGLQYETAVRVSEIINVAVEEGKAPEDIDFAGFEEYADMLRDYLQANRSYLGQMDLNIKSPLVWDYYKDTLKKLSDYGVSIVRLDAFAYAPKEPGLRNFLNDPGTWDLLQKIDDIASGHALTLLPEIHASYGEGTYKVLADKGYMVYDFFLPGLLIDAFIRKNGSYLKKWGDEVIDNNIMTVNMLGCHDGIPLLDLKGLLPEEDIQNLIDTVVKRGGYVKDLHGAKNVYYQVNATYFSALGESEQRMLMARAIQLFMPGKPQIWYLDLFAGKNDYEAMKRAGAGGHKEINRTNLSLAEARELLDKPVVKKQLEMLRFRNTCPAFTEDAKVTITCEGSEMSITWINDKGTASLTVDFEKETYEIK